MTSLLMELRPFLTDDRISALSAKRALLLEDASPCSLSSVIEKSLQEIFSEQAAVNV